jgi:hypothetical protein
VIVACGLLAGRPVPLVRCWGLLGDMP